MISKKELNEIRIGKSPHRRLFDDAINRIEGGLRLKAMDSDWAKIEVTFVDDYDVDIKTKVDIKKHIVDQLNEGGFNYYFRGTQEDHHPEASPDFHVEDYTYFSKRDDQRIFLIVNW